MRTELRGPVGNPEPDMRADSSEGLDGGPWRGWELAVAGVALVATVVAIVATLRAEFLAYPGWLAVQKADFIIGPIGVGLYWRHRRPGNRLGLLLILLGLIGIVYIGSSFDQPLLFGIGVYAEVALVFLTEAAILLFPTGRLDGWVQRGILVFMALTFVVGRTIVWLTSPHSAPWFSISQCRGECPTNGAAIRSPPEWQPQLINGIRAAVIVAAVSTIALLVWKFVAGTPPRRRALAIGAPIAVLYLLLQTSYQGWQLISGSHTSAAAKPVQGWIDWAFAGARSAVWYGFLLALVGAELFAGRTLRRLLRDSLGRPSLRELEGMVRGPLGDPGLRLGFWRPHSRRWADADGQALAPPSTGQMPTEIERDGRPAVAIVHDSQLSDDPELLRAAGSVALLALENAELDAAWNDAVGELRAAQARIVRAGNDERERVERNLHDGVQQRLVAVRVKLALARDLASEGAPLGARLETLGAELERAIDELREVVHGLAPPLLRDLGIPAALESIRYHTPIELTVRAGGVGRHPPDVESAVYYACVEAIQNATKHAGPGVRVTVDVREGANELSFEVTDDGPGFDASAPYRGIGLQNMHDRLGALDGRLAIITAPGEGTVVRGSVPLHAVEAVSTPVVHSRA